MATALERVKVEYKCPVCERRHDTAEGAMSCYKSPRERFKVGDIVWGGANGSVHLIKYLDPVGSSAIDGATTTRVKDLIVAANLYEKKIEQVYLVGGFWCGAELYPIKEAEALLREMTRRMRAAEQFYSLVVKSNERSVADDPTGAPS